MRLKKLAQFRQDHYTPCSRPSIDTLRRWVDNGHIKGGIHDDTGYWVDMDVFGIAPASQDMPAVNATVSKMLEGM